MKPKFRAWDKADREMIPWNRLLNDYNLRNVFMRPEMCGLILMQSTGLKDKNGVEIYEGDIVQYQSAIFKKDWYEKIARHGPALVMMSFDERLIDNAEYFNIMAGDKRLEVVGNIYENHELLEENK